MYTTNGVFDLRPKAFNTVDVNVAAHKFIRTVINSFMVITLLRELVVNLILISVNRCVLVNRFFDDRYDCFSLYIGNHNSFYSALALDNTNNRRFARSAKPTLAFTNAANIGFVTLNITRKENIVHIQT